MKLLKELLQYARKLSKAPAKIDYFATSLPTMLLFDDDLQFRQQTTATFLMAQARLGLGRKEESVKLLREVLQHDPNHAQAAEELIALPPLKKVPETKRRTAAARRRSHAR